MICWPGVLVRGRHGLGPRIAAYQVALVMTDPRWPRCPLPSGVKAGVRAACITAITVALLRGSATRSREPGPLGLAATKPAGEDGYFFISVIRYRLLATPTRVSPELLLCNEAFHVQCYSLTVHELGTQLAAQLGLN